MSVTCQYKWIFYVSLVHIQTHYTLISLGYSKQEVESIYLLYGVIISCVYVSDTEHWKERLCALAWDTSESSLGAEHDLWMFISALVLSADLWSSVTPTTIAFVTFPLLCPIGWNLDCLSILVCYCLTEMLFFTARRRTALWYALWWNLTFQIQKNS